MSGEPKQTLAVEAPRRNEQHGGRQRARIALISLSRPSASKWHCHSHREAQNAAAESRIPVLTRAIHRTLPASRGCALIHSYIKKTVDIMLNRTMPCNRISRSCRWRELVSQQSKIDELERLLNSEEDTPIQILPNGEIREVGQATSADMGNKKPLTMRENLGGEY